MESTAERLFAEVDRQLAEVRASVEALATRSGVLVMLSALFAALVGVHLRQGGDAYFVAPLWAFGAAAVLGALILLPQLVLGPQSGHLQNWMTTRPRAALSALLAAKIVTLEANRRRLTTMIAIFYLQSGAVLVAVVLALVMAARG